MEEFNFLSGQKISKEKSKIFFSPNVSEEACVVMVQQLEFNKTNNLGKYLGFPLKHKGRNRNEFQSVVDKVQAKLAGWKTKCLSPVGCLVLIKASITPITEYTMQCYYLPTRICDRIDKLTRDFLWGSIEEKRKLHLVGWDKAIAPTNLGGLGIFQTKARNSAILAKLCWRIALNLEADWAKMLTNKYLTPTGLSERGRRLPASCTWAACKDGGAIFNKWLKWSISNGEAVNA